MPRDLADVLHHLIPEVGPASEPTAQPTPGRRARPRPLLAIPVGARDVVRAAFTWNLAVEMGRAGARATLVAPASDRASLSWPEPEVGQQNAAADSGSASAIDPNSPDIAWVPARDLAELERGARRVAADQRPACDRAGLVVVRVPPGWLRDPGAGAGLLAWTLLLTSSEGRDLLETYGIAKLVRRAAPSAQIGVTVHGARRRGEARRAFSKLAEVAARRLDLSLGSYGLLVDDLQMYRAIVARRPVGLLQPQSPSARSLRDVAGLLLGDAGIDADA